MMPRFTYGRHRKIFERAYPALKRSHARRKSLELRKKEEKIKRKN